jgi:DNA repair photolyase
VAASEVRTSPKLSVREVTCASVLHRLSFRYFSEYTANFYRGCSHACDYCYAPSLIHDERVWGSYVDAKINAPRVLRRELRQAKRDAVFLSSASDPYQPVEARYKLTRRCLEALLERQFPVLVLTRSPLVLRDIEILEKFEWVRVGFSISTVSDRFHEPGVVPIEKRLEAMRKLKDHGIRTWVSLAPVIPGVSMIDLEELFRKIKEAGVSAVSTGLLRFNGYAESKKMFEERARITSFEDVGGGVEVMEKIHQLVAMYAFEDPDTLLSWRNVDDNCRLDSYGPQLG